MKYLTRLLSLASPVLGCPHQNSPSAIGKPRTVGEAVPKLPFDPDHSLGTNHRTWSW